MYIYMHAYTYICLIDQFAIVRSHGDSTKPFNSTKPSHSTQPSSQSNAVVLLVQFK